MQILPFRPEQLREVLSLFYHTIHTANAQDYTQQQLDAWAPSVFDEKAWLLRLADSMTLTALEGNAVLGFGNLQNAHSLDCLYVRPEAQGKGIGSALLDALEEAAWKQGAGSLTAEVSITARPFFLFHGYQELRSQQVERHGVLLKNYVMSHILKK